MSVNVPMDECPLTKGDGDKSEWDRRGFWTNMCFAVGLGVPALCWVVALCGVSNSDFPSDKVATGAVTLSIYAPLLAFWRNPGETTPLRVQLWRFGMLWYIANTGYQFFWELPWFLLKQRLMKGDITEHDTGYWPWWAYGRADTRYLMHNDLVVAITGMDAAIALIEVVGCFLYFKGYNVLMGWFALCIGSCLGWGQFYFYVGEFYNNFSHIKDGWFGMYVKYGIMNIPWVVFPFIASAGFIWNLAVIYKRQGVAEHLAGEPLAGDRERGFFEEVAFFARVDPRWDLVITSERWPRRAAVFMFVFPWVFLIVDSSIYRKINYY